MGIGDYIEPEGLCHQEQQTVNIGTNIVQHYSYLNWFHLTYKASAKYSLNKNQKQVLYLIVCGLSVALSTQDKLELIYCFGERGTGKSKVICVIRYLFFFFFFFYSHITPHLPPGMAGEPLHPTTQGVASSSC